MKRLTGVLAAVALAFTLTACSGSGGEVEPTQSILTGVPAPSDEE